MAGPDEPARGAHRPAFTATLSCLPAQAGSSEATTGSLDLARSWARGRGVSRGLREVANYTEDAERSCSASVSGRFGTRFRFQPQLVPILPAACMLKSLTKRSQGCGCKCHNRPGHGLSVHDDRSSGATHLQDLCQLVQLRLSTSGQNQALQARAF